VSVFIADVKEVDSLLETPSEYVEKRSIDVILLAHFLGEKTKFLVDSLWQEIDRNLIPNVTLWAF
jgi:hypothetical protein